MNKSELYEALSNKYVSIPEKTMKMLEQFYFNPVSGMFWKIKKENIVKYITTKLSQKHFYHKIFLLRELRQKYYELTFDELFELVKEIEL